MATIDRGGIAEAFLLAHSLAGRPEVAAQWSDKSVVDDLTVGGLAVHLLRQASHTVRALIGPPPIDPPIGLLEHYQRAAAQPESHEHDNRIADEGQIHVLARSAGVLARVPELLDRPRHPDTVHVHELGWNLVTQDFLVIRALEVVVHGDDLSVSVGLEPMELPAVVTTRAVDLLSMLAVHRHGHTAVVRALSRPDRAPDDISAF